MIIDQNIIRTEIEAGKQFLNFRKILKKASLGQGLSAIETSALFHHLKEKGLEEARTLAESVRKKTKGLNSTFYTCLYITNKCINDCSYCGFRRSNKELERITLTPDQIREEARTIRNLSPKNVILIGGTLPEESYKEIVLAGTKIILEEGLNPWIEFENLSQETLEDLNRIGAEHFVLFQETYNQTKYLELHQKCLLKNNYEERLEKVNQALKAGYKNIGLGALFGLTNDYVFEVLGLYHHIKYLQERRVNVCISVPSLKLAPGLSLSDGKVRDRDIERIFITLRLAVPKVSLALSGRETEAVRNRLWGIVDQIGSGGVTNPGGRTIYREKYLGGEKQFTLNDSRTPTEIKQQLNKKGIEIKPQLSWGNN